MRDPISDDPSSLSRRLRLRGGAAAPAVAKVGSVVAAEARVAKLSGAAVVEPVTTTAARCAEIVSYRDELTYLHCRYGDLEKILWKEGWKELNEEERLALPLGREFIEVDNRLKVSAESEVLFVEVARLRARDVADVIGKILVMSRYLDPQDDPAGQAILIKAAKELQRIRCPSCRAPIAGHAPRNEAAT